MTMDVVFIAGYGRSGSTLFEQVLGKDDRFVPLGEIRHLWQRGYMLNSLCACGVAFVDCPFWSRVDREAFGGLSPSAARELFEIRRTLLRPANLPTLLGRGRRPEPAAAFDAYLTAVRAVYEAALTSATGTILIDSSKDPLHGLALARMHDVSLHVVHLVRDARGVALSLRRPKLRHEVYWKEQRETVRPPARSALVWTYRNLMATLLRSVSGSYRLLRYEDFVAEPDRALAGVHRDVGLEPGASVVDGGRIALPETHSVSGNANRFEGRDVRLRVDDAWRSDLSRTDRVAVTVLASPLLLRYRYLS